MSQILLSANDETFYQKHLQRMLKIYSSPTDQPHIYYKHSLQEDPLGYYAAHTNVLYDDDVILDFGKYWNHVYVYLGNPNYTNAIKLLKAFDIAIPFHALSKYIRTRNANMIQKSTSLLKAGMNEFVEVSNKKRKRVNNSKIKLDTMIAIDMLKDIYPVTSETLWNMMTLSVEERELLFTQHQKDALSYRIESAKVLSNILGISSFTSVEIPMKKNPYVVQIEKDTLLYRQMMKWMTAASSNLQIVIHGSLHESDASGFLRQVLLYAMFQTMIFNASDLQKYISTDASKEAIIQIDALPYTIQTITILDGKFQKNDRMKLAPFLQKYIQELQQSIPNITNVIMRSIINDNAHYFEKYYNTDITGNHWGMKTMNIPTKEDLQKQFQKIKNSAKQQDIAIRNFVRDAWKADIAIKHNAVFFTCDQHALLYHKWIVEKELMDRNAIALLIDQKIFAKIT